MVAYCDGGGKGGEPATAGGIIGGDAAPRSAQAIRSPPYPCTMNARPATSAAVPPVSTLTVALAAHMPEALAIDVYSMLVQGSDVTGVV